MRRFVLFFIIISFFTSGWSKFAEPVHAKANDYLLKPTSSSRKKATPLLTSSQSAALIDVSTGRIVYSQQGDRSLPIASLTKIMTAIVAIEQGNLSDKVKVSKNAFGKEGSSIYLKLGETISLNDLLYGLMLRSGNDAATAIAEHVGGSLEGFVYLMNQKAEQLGMDHSHFLNPHGLDAAGHHASANDMAKLTAYALHNPIFKEIVKTQSKKVTREDQPWDSVWTNKNKMLVLYPGSDGVKTGFTKIARRCLVSSATRDHQQFVAVTLNDGNDWADHSRMLDYGFKNYPLRQAINKGEQLDGRVIARQTYSYPATEAEQALFRREVRMTAPGSVAARLGEKGRIILYLGQQRIGSVPLELLPKQELIEKTSSHVDDKDQHRLTISFHQRFRANLKNILINLISWD
ncbi:MAG: D-alanyl-D-alanine carboxypeptidase [Gorillibacterium sp.]|nr:D-alanyl-D-alanine carboxypeptidase [Gorillibacterium sp.]